MGRFISSVIEEPNSHKCVGICWHFRAALENTALNVLSWQHCFTSYTWNSTEPKS